MESTLINQGWRVAMAQYDQIAKDYALSRRTENPARKFMLYPNWLEACGNIMDLWVLDLGCGNGYSTKLLQKAGAKIVFGLDESKKQIALAKKIPGVDYVVANAASIPFSDNSFDLITACYLLHYARSKKILFAFAKEIERVLKPGGNFTGINLDPRKITTRDEPYSESILSWIDTPFVEGSRIKVILLDDNHQEITSLLVYHWTLETYQEAFSQAGLNLHWKKPKMTPEGRQLNPNWREIENSCHVSIISAQKTLI